MERVAPAPRRRARLLLVLAALAGLFFMHGLSDHGMTRPITADGPPDHAAHADVATGDHAVRVSATTADPAFLSRQAGSGPDGTAASTLQVATSPGLFAEPIAAAATVGASASVASSDGDDHAGEHGGGHGGGHLMMVGLCLALLIAAVCLLPLLRSVVVGRRIRVLAVRSQAWPARPVPRPPDLVALGVCRC